MLYFKSTAAETSIDWSTGIKFWCAGKLSKYKVTLGIVRVLAPVWQYSYSSTYIHEVLEPSRETHWGRLFSLLLWWCVPLPCPFSAQAVDVPRWSWWSLLTSADLWEDRQHTVAKSHKSCSAAEVSLCKCQPKYGWYAKMTASKSYWSINCGQPRAHWAVLHASTLHARISPPLGMPLRVTLWENPYCIRYLVSELEISMMKFSDLSQVT